MDTRQRSRLVVTAVITVAIALLIALWDWDWLKPMVERRASAALGRPVRVAHFTFILRVSRRSLRMASRSTTQRHSRRAAASAGSSDCRCRSHRTR